MLGVEPPLGSTRVTSAMGTARRGRALVDIVSEILELDLLHELLGGSWGEVSKPTHRALENDFCLGKRSSADRERRACGYRLPALKALVWRDRERVAVPAHEQRRIASAITAL